MEGIPFLLILSLAIALVPIRNCILGPEPLGPKASTAPEKAGTQEEIETGNGSRENNTTQQ